MEGVDGVSSSFVTISAKLIDKSLKRDEDLFI
jgi:hypothetical protein